MQSLAILLGEVAVILRSHAALFLIDAGLLVLKTRGLAGAELAALDALRDAILLVLLTLVDVVVVLDGSCGWRGWCLGEYGEWCEAESGNKGEVFQIRDVS